MAQIFWVFKFHFLCKTGSMYPRIINAIESQSFFLFGARGTGKSSWVERAFPGALLVDLLHDSTYRELSADPSRLEQRLPADYQGWVIIDEVQRVPALLNEVHRLIERRKIRFVLTGSSARKLRRGGANLLAGRALTRSMYPFTAEELGKDFRVEDRIRTGCLPAIFGKPDAADFLQSYVVTYLREEVQAEGIVRNIGQFHRFLEAASFSQAQILSISAVSRDCGVERKVVEGYFQVLEDILIAVRVPVFEKRAKRLMTKHPKFYFFDAGVYRAVRPKGPLDSPEEIDGVALETLVFQELRAMNDYGKYGYELFTWRTQSKHEVDLVLYGERGLRAFEVKRSGRIREEDLMGLRLFLADYPKARAVFIYQGTEERFIDGIQVVPADKFFAATRSFLQ